MGIGADATASAADQCGPEGEAHRRYEGQSQIEGPIEICNGEAMRTHIKLLNRLIVPRNFT